MAALRQELGLKGDGLDSGKRQEGKSAGRSLLGKHKEDEQRRGGADPSREGDGKGLEKKENEGIVGGSSPTQSA